jgi:hypothetical protein
MGMVATAAAVATLALSGCLAAGRGGSKTADTAATTSTTVSAAAVAGPAERLAAAACHEYGVAVATPNTAVAYPDLYTADAEADQARILAGTSTTWMELAETFDTVKTEIQQIDQLQSGQTSSYANNSQSGVTLAQALGQLKGDLAAVSTVCSADGV